MRVQWGGDESRMIDVTISMPEMRHAKARTVVQTPNSLCVIIDIRFHKVKQKKIPTKCGLRYCNTINTCDCKIVYNKSLACVYRTRVFL